MCRLQNVAPLVPLAGMSSAPHQVPPASPCKFRKANILKQNSLKQKSLKLNQLKLNSLKLNLLKLDLLLLKLPKLVLLKLDVFKQREVERLRKAAAPAGSGGADVIGFGLSRR